MDLSEMNNELAIPKRSGKILIFPELRQIYSYDCVACALASVLAAYDVEVREDEVMQLAGTTKEAGTDPIGVFKVLKHFKLPYRAGPMTPQALRAAISAGHPILLMLQAYRDDPKIPWEEDYDDGHGVVCIGYEGMRFTFEDPSSYTRTWLTEKELLTRWHDVDANNKKFINWGCESGH